MGLNSPPPHDLTAERAADLIQSVFLANEKQWRAWYALANSGSAQQSAPDGVAQKLVDAVAAAIKTVRQEALREAAKVVDTVEADTDLVNFDVTIACRRIHEQLMRLASEGG